MATRRTSTPTLNAYVNLDDASPSASAWAKQLEPTDAHSLPPLMPSEWHGVAVRPGLGAMRYERLHLELDRPIVRASGAVGGRSFGFQTKPTDAPDPTEMVLINVSPFEFVGAWGGRKPWSVYLVHESQVSGEAIEQGLARLRVRDRKYLGVFAMVGLALLGATIALGVPRWMSAGLVLLMAIYWPVALRSNHDDGLKIVGLAVAAVSGAIPLKIRNAQ